MKTEFEVTFPKINREEVIKNIKALGGICTKENTLMKRVIFEKPNYNGNNYFRVRDEGDRITTTYKEISEGVLDINSVKELETVVGDFDEMVEIYKKTGLIKKSYQETYREVWEIDNEIEFMIDLWPGLNPYIEIEGESEELVIKYTKLLGFEYDEGIFGDSFEIYKRELGLSFDDMKGIKEMTFNNPPKSKIKY